jgi:hypothetical protein
MAEPMLELFIPSEFTGLNFLRLSLEELIITWCLSISIQRVLTAPSRACSRTLQR